MSEDIKKTMENIKNTFSCANASGQHATCKHTFQDEKYGKGKRVFTKLGGGTAAGSNTKRCTVCGTMAS